MLKSWSPEPAEAVFKLRPRRRPKGRQNKNQKNLKLPDRYFALVGLAAQR
jgi:hypothetical protein